MEARRKKASRAEEEQGETSQVAVKESRRVVGSKKRKRGHEGMCRGFNAFLSTGIAIIKNKELLTFLCRIDPTSETRKSQTKTVGRKQINCQIQSAALPFFLLQSEPSQMPLGPLAFMIRLPVKRRLLLQG